MNTQAQTPPKDRKVFAIDVISRSISSFGDLIFYPVMLAIAATLENPAQAMLLVSLSESIPILLAIFIGAFSDRLVHVLKSMHILNILRFLLYLCSGLLFFRNVTFAFYITIGINFVSDCIGKAYNPLANALLVTYASENTMIEKQGALNSVQGIIQVIAPLLGTVLLATLSYGIIGIINAGTFLITSATLLIAGKSFQKYSAKIASERAATHTQTNTIAQVKKSMNFIFNNKVLLMIVLICLVINMLTIPLIRIVLPIFLIENQIAVAEQVAISLVYLNTTFAIGSIIGSLISRYFKNFLLFRLMMIDLLLIAGVLITMTFFSNLIILCALYFVLGIMSGVINTLFMGYLMQIITQDIMGGVTNAITLITAGGGIIGDLLATALLGVISSTAVFRSVSIIVIIFGVIMAGITWKRTEKLSDLAS